MSTLHPLTRSPARHSLLDTACGMLDARSHACLARRGYLFYQLLCICSVEEEEAHVPFRLFVLCAQGTICFFCSPSTQVLRLCRVCDMPRLPQRVPHAQGDGCEPVLGWRGGGGGVSFRQPCGRRVPPERERAIMDGVTEARSRSLQRWNFCMPTRLSRLEPSWLPTANLLRRRHWQWLLAEVAQQAPHNPWR